jgi:heme-degrading monooxygenase HmoA
MHHEYLCAIIMITRTWHGRTHIKDADRYLEFLLTEGTQEYRQTPGNVSVRVWRSKEGEVCHFWTVTEWNDIDSIKAFAGEDYEKAKYYSFDQGILLEFEEHVNHYESFII